MGWQWQQFGSAVRSQGKLWVVSDTAHIIEAKQPWQGTANISYSMRAHLSILLSLTAALHAAQGLWEVHRNTLQKLQ